MADVEQQLDQVIAEADERSRWTLACLSGSAGVSLLCISCILLRKSADVDASLSPNVAFALGVLLSFPAFLLCLFAAIVVTEWYIGNFIPGDQTFVDTLLSL